MTCLSFEAYIPSSPTKSVVSVPVQDLITINTISSDDATRQTNRNWMEHMEETFGRGAYDVIRCDLRYDPDNGTMHLFHQWGVEYHLNRLKMSYREILRSETAERLVVCDIDDHILDNAVIESKAIISSLTNEMLQQSFSSHLCDDTENNNSNEKPLFILIKVTLLWIPNNDKLDPTGIVVRGHAYTNGDRVNPRLRPNFITVSLALVPPNMHQEDPHPHPHPHPQYHVPDRALSPYAKLSSWSKERKMLEKQNTFQPQGIHEVLLLDKKNDVVLEGMTSNFVVIYKDDTLRTAHTDVLFGYVRSLVLKYASKCGLKIDPRPCRLEDAKNGLWKEAFLTSSSRLIYPIEKILTPVESNKTSKDGVSYDDSSFEYDCNPFRWKEFWTYNNNNRAKGNGTGTGTGTAGTGTGSIIKPNGGLNMEAKWELLWKELLSHGGY